MVIHVAACIGGPQCGPARAHGREQRGFVVDAEKALELTSEACPLPVLDQGRGAHRAGSLLAHTLALPGLNQRRAHIRRHRLLIERKADFHSEAPLRNDVGFAEAAQQICKAERRDLRPIGIGREGETTRGRQSRLRQGGKIGCLGSDPFDVRLS